MHNALNPLAIVLKVFCLLPFLTGAADLFVGTKVLTSGGAKIPEQSALDPVLNSQIKFWGAIWLGYGVSLWWASNDLTGRSGLFLILMGTLFLSGLGRAFSSYKYGRGPATLTVAIIVELAGSATLTAWHAWILS